MVNIYAFNPSHKLRFLSAFLQRASKRIRENIQNSQQTHHRAAALKLPDIDADPSRAPFNLKVFDLVDTNSRYVPQGGLFRDIEYYKDEREAGLCVFRVEDTLFKVHKCYLIREPCAFADMFSLPFVKESQSDDPIRAIPLSDTAEQFRDLLWALYAVPAQLCAPPENDAAFLGRLLNIALLASKYCIVSYEAWALDRILTLAQNPNLFLRQASPELCARALHVASLCDHRHLMDIIVQRLVARMLWSDLNRQPILHVAIRLGIPILQGVAYYRDLVDLERAHQDKGGGLTFLPSVPHEEQRLRLFSAYQSLVSLWDRIRTKPPAFEIDDHTCSEHSVCIATWTKLWSSVASSEQTTKHGVVDVLGRLKSMMIQLKKAMMESRTGMSLGCTLSALESITTARDDIVDGLIDHFHR